MVLTRINVLKTSAAPPPKISGEQRWSALLIDADHPADALNTSGVDLVAPGDRLPASSGLTWQSPSLFSDCSCARDWNENKAEWLLSAAWYTTCNGMFPELALHMAAYSPPDLDWTVSENTSERFVLGWPRSPSGWSSLQPDVDRLEKINPRKCLLIQFHPSTSHRVIFLVFRPVFPLTFCFFFARKSTKIFHVRNLNLV